MPSELRFDLSTSRRLWCTGVFISGLTAASAAAFLYTLSPAYLPAIVALLFLLLTLRRLNPAGVTLVCQAPLRLSTVRWQLQIDGHRWRTAGAAGIELNRDSAEATGLCELRCLRRFHSVLWLEAVFCGHARASRGRQLLVFADSMNAGDWRWLRCVLRLQDTE